MIRLQHNKVDNDPLLIKAREMTKEFHEHSGNCIVNGVTYTYSAIEFFEGAQRMYIATINRNGQLSNGKASCLPEAYAQAFKSFIQ
ncbi:Hypothetical protein EHI5A_013510 [Entamoeba histolytica KU27]|uniref:Uncharacterized protein n=1 Tax=Entamoeba histolytica KU27 TaxID=885311 RepID=M2R2I5_ENTHI|nr:Hypothetical protein EHI5A_013510 [Entamoeba histolytica KU27]